jgi:hypothetical protein
MCDSLASVSLVTRHLPSNSPTNSPANPCSPSQNALSPLVPLHTGHSPATPFFPTHTRKHGGCPPPWSSQPFQNGKNFGASPHPIVIPTEGSRLCEPKRRDRGRHRSVSRSMGPHHARCIEAFACTIHKSPITLSPSFTRNLFRFTFFTKNTGRGLHTHVPLRNAPTPLLTRHFAAPPYNTCHDSTPTHGATIHDDL